MLLFRVLGSWVRGLYLMGFGAFWLAISYYLSRSGGMGANPTMLSMGLIGALTFASGLFIIVRGLSMTSERSPLPKGSAGWRDDGKRSDSDTGFDADAAIARYLQNKPEPNAGIADEATAMPDAVAAPPPRPSFGRKQV